MTAWLEHPLTTLADIERFETTVPLTERIPQRSVYDVLVRAAEQHGGRTALTMVMTGDDDGCVNSGRDTASESPFISFEIGRASPCG